SALIDKLVRAHLHPPDGRMLDWKAVLVAGQPATEIVRACADQLSDLVVIRSRRRALGRLRGSTAQSLTRSAPCPILITGPGEREWAGLTTNEIDLRRVLVAYDFSPLSDQALSIGLSLAQEFQAGIDLMHVLPGGMLRIAGREIDTYDADIQQLATRLSNALPSEAALWCEVKEVLREGDPAKEILDHASKNSIDLICIGASAQEPLMNRVLGSTADAVVRNASCPVLVARPTAGSDKS
ncbi:MAG TPA: universal stress protein, partial [Blastocatellia bacterium]|nr:universal stress protein [Blastocatellia bacterium]